MKVSEKLTPEKHAELIPQAYYVLREEGKNDLEAFTMLIDLYLPVIKDQRVIGERIREGRRLYREIQEAMNTPLKNKPCYCYFEYNPACPTHGTC